jgi:hypothetical protein
MPLNLEGGISRLVTALRVSGKVWLWTVLILWALYIGLSAEFRTGNGVIGMAAIGVVIAGVPAGLLISIAWLLAGFIEPKR